MAHVELENDGKGKHQSWTATIHIPTHPFSDGYSSGEIIGYGATAQEALSNLDKQAQELCLFVANAVLMGPDVET